MYVYVLMYTHAYIYIYICAYIDVNAHIFIYIYVHVCVCMSKTPTAMDRRPLPLSFRPLWLHSSTVGVFAAFGIFAYVGFVHYLDRA